MIDRIVLMIDGDLGAEVEKACATLAAALATQAGVPVTVSAVPIARLDALRDSLARDPDVRSREYAPVLAGPASAMGSAPFVWTADARPDWGSMWTTFCELALYGGPPQRGPDNPLRAPSVPLTDADAEMLGEMRRGIWETARLYAEATPSGWLAVSCESPKMAAWMCAAILLENVDARVEEDRLLLPAGPGYRLKDEVKSIITVVAKTHHYWQAHVVGAGDP